MLSDESKAIQKFILDRLTLILDQIVLRDPEFRELGERSQALMKQLAAKLSPEDWKLLDQYDCGRMEEMNRQDEIIYSQALMDGMLFGYWVAIVSRGVEEIRV